MTILHSTSDNSRHIYEPSQVFKACIAEHGEYLKEYMYMDSTNEYTHHFKNIISRKYITVTL